MKRFLVTGASGLLGWHLCRALLRAGADVTAIALRHPPPAGVARKVTLDLTDEPALRALCRSLEVDVVIHAAAEIRTDVCQREEAATRRLNVEVPRILVKELGEQANPPQLVFVSSDLVFDGRRGGYREDDTPSPLMVYGQQKVEAERLVRAYAGLWSIARVALMYGGGPSAHPSFLGWLDAGLRGGGVRLFDDEFRTAVYVGDVCRALMALCERRAGGLFHVGGAERLSRAAFGSIYAEVFGLDARRITATQLSATDVAVPRPADVSLDSSLARRELDYVPRALREALRLVASARPRAEPS